MGWMQKKNMFIRKLPRYIFIFIFLMWDSYLRSAPFRLNAVKHCVFRKSVAALIALRFKRCQGYSKCFRLNAIGFCVFRKSAAALIFVRLILFFRVYTVWIAFAGFITFVANLHYIWVNYYICGQLLHSRWLHHFWQKQNYGSSKYQFRKIEGSRKRV